MSIVIMAMGLFFIFEGILPFLAPDFWRKMVARLARQGHAVLRTAGFLSMLVGVILMYISHHTITG